MKLKKLFILTISMLLGIGTSMAQPPAWWENYATNEVMLINLQGSSGEFTMNGDNISPGSYIGAFVDTIGGGNPYCVGLNLVQGADITMEINEPPANANSAIYFLLFENNDQCIAYDVNTTIAQFDYQFHANQTFDMTAFIAKSSTFEYSQTEYCQNEDNPLPVISGNVPNLEFMSSAQVDMFTGEIDLDMTPPDTYRITLVSPGVCMFNTTVDITINPAEDCNPAEAILAPGSSNPDYREYYFSGSGTVRIYDKSGVIVRTLEAPISWDGTNDNGQLLAPDEYYVRVNDGEAMVITVLR